MKALEFLKQHRVYEDETIYNSVGEIVGTISQLMEEYAALHQPLVSRQLPPNCSKCGRSGYSTGTPFCTDDFCNGGNLR